MASITAERPQFYEGQYLGADDLTTIVEYLRSSMGRQNLAQHSWGIAIGLDLVSQAITETTVEYYLQPGVAIDGYGRIIVVSNPTRVEADQFAGAGSGPVNVWLNYVESEFSATRPGFNACGASDDYARVTESFEIVVGSKNSILDRQGGITVNDSALVDAREALISVDPAAPLLCDASVPHQDFPYDEDNTLWLVPLGHVIWSPGDNGFLPLVSAADLEELEIGNKTSDEVYQHLMSGRAKRRLLGVVAESVFAADGLLRLRERTMEPDPARGNDAVCADQQIENVDLVYCDGRLKPKELVWVEGNLRVEGDARLAGGRLEFKDANAGDYIKRSFGLGGVDPITPTLLQRSEANLHGGVDLRVMLGKSDNGINRFTVGDVEYSGDDLCQIEEQSQNHVVIQDNGRVGIGTTNPDSQLESPYTVRALKQEHEPGEPEPEEDEGTVYRLETYQDESGNARWRLDLWQNADGESEGLSFTQASTEAARLHLRAGGNVGVGTTEPDELLHIQSDDPKLKIDINGDSGLHNSAIEFASDGATGAEIYWNKDLDKLYIRHSGDNSMVIDEDKVGLGTATPKTKLHITSGTDVTMADNSGYMVIGEVDGENVAYDFNVIQARNNGSVSELHLQTDGGDLEIHHNKSMSTRIMIQNDGDVGLGTSSPGAKLDVRGNIRFGDSGNLRAMAGVENLRTIVGRVSSGGAIQQGAGYSVSKGSAGRYTINFNNSFDSSPVVVVSMYNEDEHIASVHSVNSSSFQVRSRDMFGSNAGDLQNAAFTFIAIGER